MRFRKYTISREDVLKNTKDLVPEEFDGRYKYYVELHGKKFPVKQAVQSATGLNKGEFISMDANRILKKLGFTVREVPAAYDAGTEEKVRDSYQSSGGYRFAVTLRSGEDGYLIASCSALPGCHSQGRTEEEAISNIREAIRGYIASMKRHGEEIPTITEVREIEVTL